MYSVCYKFVNIDYKFHLLFSLLTRFMLIIYGIHHDQFSDVKYTDIDYKVFTDASRHVLNGNSPYDRHTYRYSPLVAICLIPNVTLHHVFGKVLFSFIDIIVAILIRQIVKYTLKEYQCYVQKDKRKQMITILSQLKLLALKIVKNSGNQINISQKLY
ncbi:hypothetical protein NQ314_019371 [Rhamnusium bicolor]|uniref:GPI alpha-1,4-mannosyltransferase I, catalytic subunit n=1 Tax=Rhamnusium bicolor TaxID=1586634 RepID=A0AAV8WQT9_9CUCU|nr:hypothetical protein NQ314_019371 [Rhamnusium bicolor]